jgi:hypothetical protein
MGRVALIALLGVVIYAYINYKNKSSYHKKSAVEEKTLSSRVYKNTQDDVVAYIVNVINNGSSKLGVSKEVMEGGYIPKDMAKDVACYVYELSGKKCKGGYSKDASMYFSSSCAGCHGVDGKGTGGAYPNLTKNRLLGIGK